MTTENKNTEYDNPNSHFGGIICAMDFDTEHPGSRNIAQRIVSDWAFDKQCKKNEEIRNRMMKEKKENEKIKIQENK